MATRVEATVRGRHRSGRALGPGQCLFLALAICSAFWSVVVLGLWLVLR